ncbi:cupin domain-containing protein [Photobacterium frigidiphilum]|uniref:Cupin domain-containing protein n=1 Tax=Photobacterium frigidiphilum TaxID=264736 RepID=A0A2T3J801_9GAMM|nr:cupin domain-containing protein [Photobacterium frigidiphilum]PSU44903.1 cupin domain-containing protein [Photobacterium frigidiphilum]
MIRFLTFTLLAVSISANAATSTDLVKSTTTWDGHKLPPYSLVQPEVTIKEIIIEPGEKLPWHQHPVINAGVLISGELTVHTEEKSLKMKAGDSLVELVNTSHYGENTGKVPAKIIVFYLSEKNQKVTVIDKTQ